MRSLPRDCGTTSVPRVLMHLCVSDGGRALASAEAFKPDLIVLDLMLPGVSGFELCRAIRDAGETPILVLTARSQKADKIRCLDLRRRRLPDQAVRSRGAARADPGHPAAHSPQPGNADDRLGHGRFQVAAGLARRHGPPSDPQGIRDPQLPGGARRPRRPPRGALEGIVGLRANAVHALGRYRRGTTPKKD